MKTAKVSMFLQRHAALWPILLMSILLGIGFYFYPWVSDDLYFRLPFREYFLCGKSVGYVDVLKAFKYIMDTCNSRLANFAMFHIVFLPHWLTVVLTSAASGVCVWLGLRLINKQHSFVTSVLFCSIYVLFMPWVDQLYVIVFQANYVWAAVISLSLCLAYLTKQWTWPIMLLYGLLVGVWQECSGLPVMVGLCVLAVLRKKYRDKRTFATIVGIFIGLVWLWLSPGGKLYRANNLGTSHENSLIAYLFYVPIVIYGVICCVRAYKHRISDLDILFLSMSLVPCAVNLVYPMGPRLLWYGNMTAYIGIINSIKLRRSVDYVISYALYAVMCIHLVAVAYYCYIERENYRYITDKLQHTSYKTTIYASMLNREDLPLIAMQKPHVNSFSHYRNVLSIDKFYSGVTDCTKMHCVVPKQLEGIMSTDGEPIAGDDGFRYINGYIVGLSVADWPCGLPLTIKSGGQTVSEGFYHVPFTTADGKQMAWYHLDRSSLWQLLHTRPELLKFQ